MRPKQLSYRETIEQELRALRRLRDKRLCGGPAYENGACCAVGALNAHVQMPGAEPMDEAAVKEAAGFFSLRCYQVRAAFEIVEANDEFRRGDNSQEAQRARYAYMVQWCLDKLAEPQSVSA